MQIRHSIRFDQICSRGLASVYRILAKCSLCKALRLSVYQDVIEPLSRVSKNEQVLFQGVYGYSLRMASFLSIGD
jgi:hypothetical protein